MSVDTDGKGENNMKLTKEQIIKEVNRGIGFFIKDNDYKPFADLDGTEAKRYLESLGFKVIDHGDVMTHGYALTSEGVYLSTNGYILLRKELL